ncbi:MAG: tetratricopeptide repeat protein, partial [Chloroflexota bacterium]|nr:tetratricopeptide repeat protein [Chloroflexota bacterium]
ASVTADDLPTRAPSDTNFSQTIHIVDTDGAPPEWVMDHSALRIEPNTSPERPPNSGHDATQIMRPISLNAPDVPTLRAVVGRLLAKDPADRYPSAENALADLCRAVGLPPPPETTEIRDSFLQAARFVGRDADLARLTTALDAINQPHPKPNDLHPPALNEAVPLSEGESQRGWLIGGESGVGKSRLIDELRTVALVRHVTVLRGQAVAGADGGAGGLPYQLWRAPLRALLIRLDELRAPLTPTERGLLHILVPDIDALVPPDATATAATASPIADKDRGQRLAVLIVTLLQSYGKPTLLLLEDLQWGAESIDLLQKVLLISETSDAPLPLMIVGTYRSDERPELPADLPRMTAIRLERFTSVQVAALSAAILGDAGSQTAVQAVLTRESGGNVFFLIEVARALAAHAGGLDAIHANNLPDTIFAGGVRQVVVARLNRLPAAALERLKFAAVAGRDLDITLLTAVGTLDDDDRWLAASADRAILEAVEGGWRFAHDQVRAALLEALTDAERSAISGQLAHAVEWLYADRLDDYAATLLDWYTAADDADKVAIYVVRSARAALNLNRYPDAAALFQRAFDLRVADGYAPAQMGELFHDAARVQHYIGRFEAAASLIEQAITAYRTANAPLDVAKTLDLRGNGELRRGNLDAAQACFEESRAIYQAAHDMTGLVASDLDLSALAFRRDNLHEAVARAITALERARQTNSKRLISRAGNYLGIAYDQLGDHIRARLYLEEAVAIDRALDDRSGICYNLANLGSALRALGELGAASAAVNEALLLAQQIGDRYAEGHVLGMVADLNVVQGDYATALTYYRRSLAINRVTGSILDTTYDLLRIANVWRMSGDVATARGCLSDVLPSLVAAPIGSLRSMFIKMMGLLLDAEGDTTAALPLLAYGARVGSHDDEQIECERRAAILTETLPDGAALAAVGAAWDADRAWEQVIAHLEVKIS